MKSIGFKNFRRFEELKPLQLGEITFFVGANNAGKSTVVKAMMLMLDNLSERRESSTSECALGMPNFRLDANRIHEVHIGTFGRALHKPYPEEKTLSLEAEIEDYYFKCDIIGDTESSQANANISRVEIANMRNHVKYYFDYIKNSVKIVYNELILKEYAGGFEADIEAKTIRNYLIYSTQLRDSIIKEISETTDTVELARLNSRLKETEKRINAIKKSLNPLGSVLTNKDLTYEWSIKGSEELNFIRLLMEKAREIRDIQQKEIPMNSKDSEIVDYVGYISSDKKKSYAKDRAFGHMLRQEAQLIGQAIIENGIEYISAHAATQKVLFSIEDKNDYMATVIREFKQCRIVDGDKEDTFIKRWMHSLEIGLDYKIKAISGEAYTMDITNMQGDIMPLADMGMGSIQIMILLLRLATIIHDEIGEECIVVVEEPEQNIHPKLQSLLTELFAEVNQKYGFRFVIETHSEYMIRKSQAMIAKGDVSFDKNPFKVYYFPEDRLPYDMVYQESGLFENKFDEGFFDEASRQHVVVMKKARDLQ